jgi:lipid-A-disaccharide synthase
VPLCLAEQLILCGDDGNSRAILYRRPSRKLCASGTATLEVGLLGTPTIVVYRLARWTWLAAKWLVKLPNVSLVNLVLGREVVPELLQGEAVPDRIAAECSRLLSERETIREMRRGLGELRPALGASGASSRAAEEVLAVMGRLAA